MEISMCLEFLITKATHFLSSIICGPIELLSFCELVARFADENMARRLAK